MPPRRDGPRCIRWRGRGGRTAASIFRARCRPAPSTASNWCDGCVAHGADINARLTKEPRDGNRNMLNRIGATPFLMAAKTADVPLMRLLLERGANPKV